mmetsp:Transcript_23893/g.82639  ORF Transcript_23893/g.82639 Transcript_23893/m.82639 type:complete len:229 (-) Transcript_23893:166-852(-)
MTACVGRITLWTLVMSAKTALSGIIVIVTLEPQAFASSFAKAWPSNDGAVSATKTSKRRPLTDAAFLIKSRTLREFPSVMITSWLCTCCSAWAEMGSRTPSTSSYSSTICSMTFWRNSAWGISKDLSRDSEDPVSTSESDGCSDTSVGDSSARWRTRRAWSSRTIINTRRIMFPTASSKGCALTSASPTWRSRRINSPAVAQRHVPTSLRSKATVCKAHANEPRTSRR